MQTFSDDAPQFVTLLWIQFHANNCSIVVAYSPKNGSFLFVSRVHEGDCILVDNTLNRAQGVPSLDFL